jgi:hypothetical protein
VAPWLGASTYKELATHHHLSIPILLGGAGLVFLLYIFDFSYCPGPPGALKRP